MSDGQLDHFKTWNYTNNSVYADYSSQLSLSDFLYVAEPSILSLALTEGTK